MLCKFQFRITIRYNTDISVTRRWFCSAFFEVSCMYHYECAFFFSIKVWCSPFGIIIHVSFPYYFLIQSKNYTSVYATYYLVGYITHSNARGIHLVLSTMNALTQATSTAFLFGHLYVLTSAHYFLTFPWNLNRSKGQPSLGPCYENFARDPCLSTYFFQ